MFRQLQKNNKQTTQCYGDKRVSVQRGHPLFLTGVFRAVLLTSLLFQVGCGFNDEDAQAQVEPDRSLGEQMLAVNSGETKFIDLDQTFINDDQAKLISQLDAVENIKLGNCAITDVGLSYFAKMPNLKGIRLSSTRISDEGMAELAGNPSLRFLIIFDAPITDMGLRYLYPLKHLESLYLINTQITEEGKAELQASLPGLHIH